jgi:hypothetical protein
MMFPNLLEDPASPYLFLASQIIQLSFQLSIKEGRIGKGKNIYYESEINWRAKMATYANGAKKAIISQGEKGRE